MKNLHTNLLLSSSIILLSACGGGGNGSDTNGEKPASPELTLNFEAIKEFSFSWVDVADETHYRLLENSDGASGFTKIATPEENTKQFTYTVPLYEKINASYILEACNASGCSASDVVTVSGNMAAAIGYFKASNAEQTDTFGFAVTLSANGTTLAVSASQEDSNSTGINKAETNNDAANSGAVYVYNKDSVNGWQQQAYIKASVTDKDDFFGRAISLSDDGNTLAVGAPGEDSNMKGVGKVSGFAGITQESNGVLDSGAVYIFKRDQVGTWSQQEFIKASNPDPIDEFGHALQLSGDAKTLIVGAPGEDSFANLGGNQDNNDTKNSGAAYIFAEDDNNGWTQQAYIKSFSTGEGDLFGSSVSISNNGGKVAVSAYNEDSAANTIGGDSANNNSPGSGAVYTYLRVNNSWNEREYFKPTNTQAGDKFGRHIYLAGDGRTLAVSTNDGSNATGIGGNASDNSIPAAGSVFVFRLNETQRWFQQAYIKAFNTKNPDLFGSSVSLSDDGNLLAVGALREKSDSQGLNGNQINDLAADSGAVYTYKRVGSNWSQQAYIKASNSEQKDHFGGSLALSSDGKTLAVGATRESSNAQSIGGDRQNNDSTLSGAVYLY